MKIKKLLALLLTLCMLLSLFPATALADEPEETDAPAAEGALDAMIATIPEQFDVAAYAACVKPFGTFTTVGMAKSFRLDVNAAALAGTRVNFNASLIGGMKETQELVNYCAEHNITPQVQMIAADKINEAWENVLAKKARFRYVIDASTF